MEKIYILKSKDGYESGEIILVDERLANILIKKGIARKVSAKDYLVKPLFGISKAFNKFT